MTKVTIRKTKSGDYVSFRCQGHTGYAEEGEDIVCAGVSAIVINTVNCLQDLTDAKFTLDYAEDGGDISLKFTDRPGEKAVFLVDCMIHGLKWIRMQYGREYLNYEIKEV